MGRAAWPRPAGLALAPLVHRLHVDISDYFQDVSKLGTLSRCWNLRPGGPGEAERPGPRASQPSVLPMLQINTPHCLWDGWFPQLMILALVCGLLSSTLCLPGPLTGYEMFALFWNLMNMSQCSSKNIGPMYVEVSGRSARNVPGGWDFL